MNQVRKILKVQSDENDSVHVIYTKILYDSMNQIEGFLREREILVPEIEKFKISIHYQDTDGSITAKIKEIWDSTLSDLIGFHIIN